MMYRRNKTRGDVVTNDHCELIVVTSYTLGSRDSINILLDDAQETTFYDDKHALRGP